MRFYEPGLDVVRATACLMVLFHHIGSRVLSGITDLPTWLLPARGLAAGGGLGVIYFFTLSSYLLTKLILIEQQEQHRVDLRKFWVRRCLRIWPLYFAYLLALMVANALAPSLSALPDVWSTGSLFTFAYNWLGWQPTVSPSMAAILWSVCVEEQFYALFTVFIFALGPKRLLHASWVLILLGPLCRVATTVLELPYPAIWMMTTSHLDAFGCGMLGACVGLDRMQNKRGALSVVLVLVAVTFPLVGGLGLGSDVYKGWWSVGSYSLAALMSLLMIVALSGRAPKGADARWRVLVWIGRRSYGIYVLHWFALMLVAYFTPTFSLQSAVATLALTVFLSAASYRLLEEPFLRLKKRYELVDTRPAALGGPPTA